MEITKMLRKLSKYIFCGIFLVQSQQIEANIFFSSPQSAVSVQSGSLLFKTAISGWNGTLDVPSGSVSGSTIGFSRGVYTNSLSAGYVTGQLNPTSQTLTLSGAQRFRANPGFAAPALNINGTANVVEGSPCFTGPITLSTAGAEVQFNIQSKLNKNIVLNGGALTLLNDLSLEDDVMISGSGTVNINYKTLNLPALPSTWTSNLLLNNPSDIKLNSKTSLSGTWSFKGNSVLNGNGNILDLTSGGTLFVQSGSSVQFTNVHIKGIGSGLGSLAFQNKTAEVRLSNCTLEFSAAYTFSTGGIYVEGDKCVFITGTNSVALTSNASLTVDKVTLYADALTATPTVNLAPNIPNTLNLVYVNNGSIKSIADGGLVVATSNAAVSTNNLAVATSNLAITTNTLAIATSNAVNGLLVDTSNAVAGLLVATSNAVAGLVVANSYAIVAAKQLAIDDSNALVSWGVGTSNAVNGLLVAVSNATVAGQSFNIANSNAIVTINQLNIANSYAVVNVNNLAIATSNAVLALSAALMTSNSLAIDNSNAIIGWIKDTSNAVAGLVVANSYAIVAAKQLAIDDSNALVSWGVATSNAVNGLLVATSNAVAGLLVSVSNATVAAQNFNIANSNAIVTINTLNIANSYAIVNVNNLAIATSNAVLALSSAIVSSNSLAIDNSNAIVGWIKATSNAVAGLLVDTSNAVVADRALTVANSNAITGWVRDTSNAVFNFVLYNSQAIVTINTLNIANSYAIITTNELSTANSYAVINVLNLAVATSNALIANKDLDIATSNAVVANSILSIANSNAIVGWVRDTSNAVAGLLVAVSNATVGVNTLNIANSNAIVTINNNANEALNELYTIDHGPAHIHFNSSTITMSFAHNISPDHLLYVHASGVVNGDTHMINFTTSANSIFIVDPGVTVTMQNVELRGIAPEAVSLGSGSQLLFGEGARLRLARGTSLNTTWSFVGNATIDGAGNELNLSIADAIRVADGKTLTIKDTIITGLGGAGINNMRLMGAGAGLDLFNVHLILSSNFSFTLGSVVVSGDSTISGSGSTFAYTSPQACTINNGVTLYLDKGLTFSYDSVAAAKDRLVFAGSKSRLHLDGCTVHATHTGLLLTGGTMLVDDTVVLRNEASNEAEATVLDSSLSIYVLGGGTLEMGNGIIVYQ